MSPLRAPRGRHQPHGHQPSGDPGPRATAQAHEELPWGLRPMLAVAGELPDGERWSYELKWDGVRALGFVSSGHPRLVSRSGRDLSETYPELVAGRPLGRRTALVDGEVVALDEGGRPSFQALQSRLEARKRARPPPLCYLVFDLLHLGGGPLLDQPWSVRREALEGLSLAAEGWSVPEAFGPPGPEVLAASRRSGLEGVVAKRRDSSYQPGRRSKAWVKVKNFRTQEVVVGGWTEGEGRRRGSFGSLLLGVPGARGLDYVGNVGTGFDEAGLARLLARLRPLERPRSAFAGPLPGPRARRAHFVEPVVVGEVRFTEWTEDGRLRQAAWRGLRADKEPGEVRREP